MVETGIFRIEKRAFTGLEKKLSLFLSCSEFWGCFRVRRQEANSLLEGLRGNVSRIQKIDFHYIHFGKSPVKMFGVGKLSVFVFQFILKKKKKKTINPNKILLIKFDVTTSSM